jgi:glycosyltransferase involved in cell wall biosynthesis
LKVLHLCNLPIPKEHPDHGRVPYHRHPGRWVLNLALAQKAHTSIAPQLMVQVPGAKNDFDCEIEGVPVYFQAAPDRFRSASFFYFDTKRLIPTIRSFGPRVVHAHGTEDAYSLAAQRSKLPYVITAQGLHFLINRKVSPRFVSREKIVEFLECRCLKNARDVIAKSRYVCESLAAEFPNLQLHEIPNTIDPRLFDISADKKKNVVAFVGTIIPRKGLDLICDALAIVKQNIPDVVLWIFGDYAESASDYETTLKARLKTLLGDRVVFHGAVPAFQLASRLAAASVLVAPSREEMFGNQLIESLILDTYAIVSAGTAMAENVERFGGGVVVPQEDVKALADAIFVALTNPPHVPTAIVRKRIRDYMGPEIVARRHLDVYRQLPGMR